MGMDSMHLLPSSHMTDSSQTTYSSVSSSTCTGKATSSNAESAHPAGAKEASVIDGSTEARTKPKQSKSRNGCVTCKGKRLKCDETKPTCQQCQKRGVECGGYKKDFKWRAYEESALTSKTPKQSRKSVNGVTKTKKIPPPLSSAALHANNDHSISMLSASLSPFSPPFDSPSPYDMSPQYSFHQDLPLSSKSQYFDLDHDYMLPHDNSLSISPSSNSQLENLHHSQASQSSIDTYVDVNSMTGYSSTEVMSVTGMSAQDLHNSVLPSISVESALFSIENGGIKQEETEEERMSESIAALSEANSWPISYPSPTMSDRSSSSSDSHSTYLALTRQMPLTTGAGSPEMLMFHFDKYTCGIMSIKNGPTENPWRTLIWPLAQETPALYHAIAAMTAFHMSRKSPAYRVEGVEHVRQSLGALSYGIGNGTMSDEGALATTLVLAFSEAFDRHISTGHQHLKGAKILISQALEKHKQNPQWGEGLRRLKFLHNVWVYLDVLARLTSDGDDDNSTTSMLFGPLSATEEIDPLMGCATTLFPLIGQVANLVRKVRQSPSNTLTMINQAAELKSMLENWIPGTDFRPTEDQNSEIIHCLRTAEAYQYATLLYLHQAFPEIPSQTSHQLAKRVLRLLASIPITSGACVVHIYPLLAAGCEAQSKEERRWVKKRWEQLSARMWIGNVDKAWQVVKEVWDRRDAHARQRGVEARLGRSGLLRPQYSNSHPASRSSSVPRGLSPEASLSQEFAGGAPEQQQFLLFNEWGVPVDSRVRPQRPTIVRSSSEGLVDEYNSNMEEDVCVKSRLHWVGVMKEWQWEVLLG